MSLTVSVPQRAMFVEGRCQVEVRGEGCAGFGRQVSWVVGVTVRLHWQSKASGRVEECRWFVLEVKQASRAANVTRVR